ncbi:MAG: hypothetical protein ACYDCB_01185 [Candidatus Dormibacteria bacterium]
MTETSQTQSEVVGWLGQGGCVRCAEELASQRRFFFWYISENYCAPETVDRVGASLGFCRRHTRQLVGLADPSTLGHIFEQIGRVALAAVEQAQSALPGRLTPAGLAQGLRPSQECLACQTERESGGRRVATLIRELPAPAVRSAFEEASPLCLEHLVWSWGELGEAAWPVARRIAELLATGAPDWVQTLITLRGVDLAGEERAPAAERQPAPAEPARGWSTGLDELEAEMELGACPACARAEREQAAHLSWLAHEVELAPYHRWAAAADLCRGHSWALLGGSGAGAAEPLWEMMRNQASTRLGMAMAERLTTAARVPWGRNRSGWVPPELRRERQCPACRAYQAAEERVCELLTLAIEEPRVNVHYGRSGGLCLRHLPVAVGRARNLRQAGVLLQAAGVRLAVLEWELAESSRRRGWDTRWEPPSQTDQSWRRAVEHLGGIPPPVADGTGS